MKFMASNFKGLLLINPHLVVFDHLAETGVPFTDPTVELWHSHSLCLLDPRALCLITISTTLVQVYSVIQLAICKCVTVILLPLDVVKTVFLLKRYLATVGNYCKVRICGLANKIDVVTSVRTMTLNISTCLVRQLFNRTENTSKYNQLP